jgi:hypothetical protein
MAMVFRNKNKCFPPPPLSLVFAPDLDKSRASDHNKEDAAELRDESYPDGAWEGMLIDVIAHMAEHAALVYIPVSTALVAKRYANYTPQAPDSGLVDEKWSDQAKIGFGFVDDKTKQLGEIAGFDLAKFLDPRTTPGFVFCDMFPGSAAKWADLAAKDGGQFYALAGDLLLKKTIVDKELAYTPALPAKVWTASSGNSCCLSPPSVLAAAR